MAANRPSRTPGGGNTRSNLFHVYPAERLVVLSLSETTPAFEPWAAVMEQVFAHPEFEAGFGIVSDRRSVQQAPLSAVMNDVIRFLVDAAGARRFVGRFATVLQPADPITFALWTRLEELGKNAGLDLCIFTNFDEAIRWATCQDTTQ